MGKVRLPVIVGFGGINAAGRSSGHHAFARMTYSAQSQQSRAATRASLARLMGAEASNEQYLLDHTLVRRIEGSHFDVDAVQWNQRMTVLGEEQPSSFEIARKHLPDVIPIDWAIEPVSVTHVRVQIRNEQDLLLPTQREFEVKSAGMLPTGFDPGTLYPSRNHPRGLQMTVFAATDALGSIGIDWDTIAARVAPDEVSVYAGSAMGQLDGAGAGGMLKSRYNGQRVTSKSCPLSFAEMPADFINAYVLGSLGSTGASLGACASFLYNLRHGIDDIRSGRARVAFVGSAEAPVLPEVMEGYAAMGALATEKGLRQLDALSDEQEPDFRRACRPFAQNCGFTIAESSQMMVLFDDELAMELGATMLGAATDVFVNADGYKKSIAGPGVGNYITMARALAAARGVLGEEGVRQGGMVMAHGTGTPQNRVSEARILSQAAAAFGIESWPVAAIKCFVGHSIGSAAGDQIGATLGAWHHGLLPGISTIDNIAEDVTQENLAFSRDHVQVDPQQQRYAIINSKGFGGNNASAALMSPVSTQTMLQARYSAQQWQRWQQANEQVVQRQREFDSAMTAGTQELTYRFDHGVLGDTDIDMDASQLSVGGGIVELSAESPYADMRIS